MFIHLVSCIKLFPSICFRFVTRDICNYHIRAYVMIYKLQTSWIVENSLSSLINNDVIKTSYCYRNKSTIHTWWYMVSRRLTIFSSKIACCRLICQIRILKNNNFLRLSEWKERRRNSIEGKRKRYVHFFLFLFSSSSSIENNFDWPR